MNWQGIKKELNERLSSETISERWKKVRNASLGVFMASSSIDAVLTTLVHQNLINAPEGGLKWLNIVIIVSGAIAGRAQINKRKY
jgi:hypothetical protein